MANMAAQNEVKAKKYQEEIRVIKAAKVKLVKQMKEEADKVRQWKQTKESVFNQLKVKVEVQGEVEQGVNSEEG